jgi:hypothetical protein
MPKMLTMRAKVAFDYRGANLHPGDTFTPHNAAEAVALKNRKQADFARASQRTVATSAPAPASVPPATSTATTASTALETSQLTAADDDAPDPGDSPLTAEPATGRRGRGRGRYNRQDLRAQP